MDHNLDWEDLRLFLAVARAGGLAGACDTTGKSAPTLGRRMLALEQATGNELFFRLPRGYELTEDGAALFDRLVELEGQILQIPTTKNKRQWPLVKISAGSWMTHLICANIQQIVEPNDAVRLRFIAAEHELSITRRETIIGIRNQRPVQDELACRKLGRVHFAGYAKKADAPWVRVLGNTPSAIWLASQNDPKHQLEVSSPRNALDLALAGVACVLLPTLLGDSQAGLKQTTPVVNELSHDQWLVMHQDERHRPEVRLIIERMAKVLKTLHSSA